MKQESCHLCSQIVLHSSVPRALSAKARGHQVSYHQQAADCEGSLYTWAQLGVGVLPNSLSSTPTWEPGKVSQRDACFSAFLSYLVIGSKRRR